MSKLFYNIFYNLANSFSGLRIIFHLVAITATYVLVVSGFDWFYFTFTQTSFLVPILYPAIGLGGILPILVPLVLYTLGEIGKMSKISLAGLALGQAAILGSLVSSVYKTLTGRIQPNLMNTVVDTSNSFQFGFWEHGIFWGWPSSHTTIAFAMALTLMSLYRNNKTVFYSSLAYAFYIGIGISTSIHWFSDFLAGALIGTAIGLAVGKSFRSLLKR
ncbi:MAG: phosphatase PAP2 family protein [Parcubacteria group bacterium]